MEEQQSDSVESQCIYVSEYDLNQKHLLFHFDMHSSVPKVYVIQPFAIFKYIQPYFSHTHAVEFSKPV